MPRTSRVSRLTTSRVVTARWSSWTQSSQLTSIGPLRWTWKSQLLSSSDTSTRTRTPSWNCRAKMTLAPLNLQVSRTFSSRWRTFMGSYLRLPRKNRTVWISRSRFWKIPLRTSKRQRRTGPRLSPNSKNRWKSRKNSEKTKLRIWKTRFILKFPIKTSPRSKLMREWKIWRNRRMR